MCIRDRVNYANIKVDMLLTFKDMKCRWLLQRVVQHIFTVLLTSTLSLFRIFKIIFQNYRLVIENSNKSILYTMCILFIPLGIVVVRWNLELAKGVLFI